MVTLPKSVQSAIGEYVKTLPITDRIVRAIDLCNTDLYSGPLYTDQPGEIAPDEDHVGCWGEFPKSYPFSEACSEIAGALDDVRDIYVEEDSGCWSTREPEGEEVETGEVDDDGEPIMEWIEPMPYYLIERREIIAEIVGMELAHYVR